MRGCRCEFPGMSGHRCEVGGPRTPELPGPVLREGKLETGSVPTAKRPRPGSSADTSKCSSTRSPSSHAPACPAASGPDSSSLEEHEPLLVLGSGVAATGRRLRALGWGPKAVVEWSAPHALTPLPARRPSTARGGLYFSGHHLDPVATGSRVHKREVQPRSPMLGPRCARRARWVGRCGEVSAPGMPAGNGGVQLGDPVRGPTAEGVLTGLVLFPTAFWRIGYKG